MSHVPLLRPRPSVQASPCNANRSKGRIDEENLIRAAAGCLDDVHADRRMSNHQIVLFLALTQEESEEGTQVGFASSTNLPNTEALLFFNLDFLTSAASTLAS